MEEVLAARGRYRLSQWSTTIRLCRESGLSNRAFCKQNGISEKTFYYWLHKLRENALGQEPTPQLIQLNPISEAPATT